MCIELSTIVRILNLGSAPQPLERSRHHPLDETDLSFDLGCDQSWECYQDGPYPY